MVRESEGLACPLVVEVSLEEEEADFLLRRARRERRAPMIGEMTSNRMRTAVRGRAWDLSARRGRQNRRRCALVVADARLAQAEARAARAERPSTAALRSESSMPNSLARTSVRSPTARRRCTFIANFRSTRKALHRASESNLQTSAAEVGFQTVSNSV